jgi:hypothetical protein
VPFVVFGYGSKLTLIVRTSEFYAHISPREFSALARMMMEADPPAAIIAFGEALQTVQIQRREADT